MKLHYRSNIFFLYFYVVFLFVNNLHLLSTRIQLYGYVFSVLSVIFFALYRAKLNKRSLIVFAVIFLLMFSYVNLSPEFMVVRLKYIYYLLPICIIPFYFTVNDFCVVLSRVCFAVLCVSLFFFSVGIGIDYGYGNARMHGLLSEPSAMAFPITVIVLRGVYIKSPLYLFIGFSSLFFSGSLMALVVLFVAVFLFLYLQRKVWKRVYIFIFSIFGIVTFFFVIEYMAVNDYGVYFTRLYDGLIYVSTLGDQGYNPRFSSFLNVIEFVKNNNFYFGNGFNASLLYSEATGGGRDLSILMELLLSFGVVGLAVFIGVIFKEIFFRRKPFSGNEAILLSAVISYTFLNSAQGIVFQALFFVILLLVSYQAKKARFSY